VRQYLRDIGKVNLLTPEEEVTLARLVQRREHLLAQQGRPERDKPLSEAMVDQLAQVCGLKASELRLALHQGRRAKERMIQANLRLVVAVAKKYQQRGLPLQHLRLLVDSPGHHPGHRQPEPGHPPAGAHHRKAQPA
jgi:RNA polymerase nonessential primary-like sigma factor